MSSVSSWHLPSLAPGKSTSQKAGQKEPSGPAHCTMASVPQHLGNKTLAQHCLEPPAQGSPEAVQDPPRFKDLVIPPGLLHGRQLLTWATSQGFSRTRRGGSRAAGAGWFMAQVSARESGGS